MQNVTENVMPKGGLLARIWPTKLTESVPASLPAIVSQENAGNMRIQQESVPTVSQTLSPKVSPRRKPDLGSLKLVLLGGRNRTVSEIAALLQLTPVQASRLISKAEADGHVRKRKVGRHVYVRLK